MKFVTYSSAGRPGLAIETTNGNLRGALEGEPTYPGDVLSLLRAGEEALAKAGNALADGTDIDPAEVTFLPPVTSPGKIICVGLNYLDHADEAGMNLPSHPTIFSRFASSLIGHEAPIVKPLNSDELDFEGELVAIIGKAGRHIQKERALEHIAGYSLFNDASVRDYQLRTSQWTVGKNFDSTGAFGPSFVTADALPAGAKGLQLTTRLNGEKVQSASTTDMIFDVATLVAELSSAFTFEPGDIIVTGTPSGVGMARSPQLYMKHGDVCEIEVEGIGVLRNTIVEEN
ncbi:fumarylacetoacetate hydrolase family protein [Rhodococcus sp. ARC_M8]|uniref:fumarylacetoacetate hydrolase family protein n=1 Tax=Rhodococcus sp. ARC_M8 TaxID=2928853 RepID=UPI001FB50DF3|nr:fumarylacetoacetate hydrolase family protein [Rhodococcus sp. ARC_M8]MCJ0949972.1 fumarylacetoacetate hydrolase family protein [Rhodococcus sp. ARC_M8]